MTKDFEVTPWEVKGSVDYSKLVQKFGTQVIGDELANKLEAMAGESHVMLRRRYFFSHRDLDKVVEGLERGKSFFVYTGRGPSGRMHIGHIAPFFFSAWLQKVFGVNVYIAISDDEKLFVKDIERWDELDKMSANNIEVISGVGFDPDKTFIFKDSEYIGNVYPMLARIAKKINFSSAKAVFGFSGESNIGIIFYPAYQIVPTFFEQKRCLIPCGIDQDPYWRIQRDIAESFGQKASIIHSKFLPPLQGVDGKMSSSDANSGIWVDDDEKTVERKVNKYAFSGGRDTLEEHRKLGGRVEVDVPFQWLYYFFEEDDRRIKEIEEGYRKGDITSGEMKAFVIEKINLMLGKLRKNMDRGKVEKYMKTGKLAKEMWGRKYV
ncbi:MAG: tryptophan--tRNA ligase [Candidatus Anstonellales archaeon]